MEITSPADAENRLSELVNTVQGTWERVTMTKNGKPVAVLTRWPPSRRTEPVSES